MPTSDLETRPKQKVERREEATRPGAHFQPAVDIQEPEQDDDSLHICLPSLWNAAVRRSVVWAPHDPGAAGRAEPERAWIVTMRTSGPMRRGGERMILLGSRWGAVELGATCVPTTGVLCAGWSRVCVRARGIRRHAGSANGRPLAAKPGEKPRADPAATAAGDPPSSSFAVLERAAGSGTGLQGLAVVASYLTGARADRIEHVPRHDRAPTPHETLRGRARGR
jgi:hypothetical protein